MVEAITRTGLADSNKQARQFATAGSLRVDDRHVGVGDRIGLE